MADTREVLDTEFSYWAEIEQLRPGAIKDLVGCTALPVSGDQLRVNTATWSSHTSIGGPTSLLPLMREAALLVT